MNLVFREFYETLYKSEGDAPATMHEFLNKPNLQTLTDEDREHLEKEITSEEIRESIFNTAGGKSPGLDGFPIEFYRSFLPKLIEPMLGGSYRPISLLNTSYKILAKLIALRLDKVLPDLVDMDQTGFVRNRSFPDNIRRLYNIMHYVENDQESVVAASLDAEQAFDRIEWNYLLEVLHRMNIGP
jgi:hypothetical protein